MKKNVSRKIAVPVMIAVLIVVIILKGFGLLTFRSGMRYGFAGNDGIHTYNGTYSKITGSMMHDLRPSKGSDTVHCEITTKSGTLHVQIIQKSDEKVVFDREISGDETFDVAAEGKIRVKLSTEEHSGSYRFQY